MNKVIYQLSSDNYNFPPAQLAIDDPDGLLAVGGDLSPKRLIQAYQQGIFPWFSEDEPIMWWSPGKRGVLFVDDFYINRSFRKFLKKSPYRVSVNKAFCSVISHCANINRANSAGTWITGEMIQAYIDLHQLGIAHSIEVWHDKDLIGGLYGVVVGNLFCGESMFHLKPYGSKVAYMALVDLIKQHGGEFIDCQMQNEFLETLGVSEIPRELYLKKLASSLHQTLSTACWSPRFLDVD